MVLSTMRCTRHSSRPRTIIALQDQMLALQAKTTGDVAIQVTLCYYLVDSMKPYPTEDKVAELSQRLRTALASVLLVVGGTNVDRFLGAKKQNRALSSSTQMMIR
jgi:hypothetical protein